MSTIEVKNLDTELSVVQFKVKIGTPTLSSDFQSINIPYTGTADPERSGVSLSSFEYSIDGGSTWDEMTESSDTDINDLTFSSEGTSLNFEWEARSDLGGSIYNTSIMVRLIASQGGLSTTAATKSVIFLRTVTNESEEDESTFPSSYKGIPGYRLMNQAPRANTR